MSYACFYDVPADEQFYRRVMAEIGGDAPDGLVLHLVVKRDGGLRYTEVWKSQEDWERFRRERVAPALEKVFRAAGFDETPPRPIEHEIEVVDIQTLPR
ncbi:MAG: hypothetical protein M3214_07260 [Actinomycetota bacterium]|nr:hypothetical protein [Actinomycetota bacterium]